MKNLPDCKKCKNFKCSTWKMGKFVNANCKLRTEECKYEEKNVGPTETC